MVSGCVLLSLLTIAIDLLHISGNMQDLAVGAVMILAVSIDRLRRSRMFRTSLGDRGRQARYPSWLALPARSRNR